MDAVDEREPADDAVVGRAPVLVNGLVSWLRSSNERSTIISGMSRSPRGSGSAASSSSSMIIIPASPRQTFGAVRSSRWSWYH